jgi:hypothetical protein
MPVISITNAPPTYYCERQLPAKRFILHAVRLSCSVISLRSKSRAGLIMRRTECHLMELEELLEYFNEEV